MAIYHMNDEGPHISQEVSIVSPSCLAAKPMITKILFYGDPCIRCSSYNAYYGIKFHYLVSEQDTDLQSTLKIKMFNNQLIQPISFDYNVYEVQIIRNSFRM